MQRHGSSWNGPGATTAKPCGGWRSWRGCPRTPPSSSPSSSSSNRGICRWNRPWRKPAPPDPRWCGRRRGVTLAETQVEQARAPYAAPVERVRAEIQLERARVQYEQALTAVSAQVRREWLALKDAEHEVGAARRREELARSRAEINRARYDAGTLPLLELLQSEAAYAQARLDAAGAVWDYNLAKARFLRTLGRPELPPLPPEIAEYIDGWDENR